MVFTFYIIFMQIIWHGQSCFEIIIAKGKGDYATILIDPPSEAKTGLKAPKTGAQIVLATNGNYTAGKVDLDKIAPGAFLIDSPGEYEIKDIYIRGTDFNFGKAAFAQNLGGSKKEIAKDAPAGAIYTIEAEEMKICHLGNYAAPELSPAQVEKIGNVDILLFPVGVGDSGAKDSLKVISQIEPSVAVPMNYEIPKLKIAAGDLKEFLKAAGVGTVEPLAKLTVKRKDISAEEAKIVILNP